MKKSLIVAGLVLLLLVVGAPLRPLILQHQIQMQHSRADSTVPSNPLQIPDVTAPILLIVLDDSDSLAGPDGKDPGNLEFKATRLLLKLAHHFSIGGTEGSAPRLGVLAFGSRPRWLELDGKRVWSLLAESALDQAIHGLGQLIGGTNGPEGQNDRRRALYTDYNGAFVEVLRELRALNLSPGDRPIVLMMTDGEHSPNPTESWNWAKGKDRSIFVQKSVDERLDAEERSIAAIGGFEPVTPEMRRHIFDLSGAPAELQQSNTQQFLSNVFENEIYPVINSKYGEDVQQEARDRLLKEYIPELIRYQVRLHLIGLSKVNFVQAQEQKSSPDGKLWNDMIEIAEAAGHENSSLRWARDRQLARYFVEIFEEGLRLLKFRLQKENEYSFELGCAMSMAIRVEGEQESSHVHLSTPGKETVEREALGRNTVFMISNPAPGRVSLLDPEPDCEAVAYIQTNPLFHVVKAVGRESGRIDLGPPVLRMVAYSPKTGGVLQLEDAIDSPPDLELEGLIVDASGLPIEEEWEVLHEHEADLASRQIGTMVWKIRRDKGGHAIDFESHFDSSWDKLSHRPGSYAIVTSLKNLRSINANCEITPHIKTSRFDVLPGIRLTGFDANGTARDDLDFLTRMPHWWKD